MTDANVTGSSGWTPNNIVASSRANAADSINPTRVPVATTRAALSTTSRNTSLVVAPRALRHTEIPYPLLHRVGEDSEHAHHRQEEGERGERHHHHRSKAMAAGCVPGDVLERHHVPHAHQLLLVDASDGCPDRRRQRFRASRRWSNEQVDVVRRDPAPSARRSARSPLSRRAAPSPAAPHRRSRARLAAPCRRSAERRATCTPIGDRP